MATTNSLNTSWTGATVGRTAAPVREQVIGLLRKAIIDFELKPGQRLVERELVERLGVSRTTIREALRELDSEGLVTVVPQKGAMVSAPSYEDAVDLYEIRAVLESLMVRRFTERASDEDVARLRQSVENLHEVSMRTVSVQQILATKDEFYAVLIECAGSPVLEQMVDSIQARVQILRATSLSEEGRVFAAIRELRAIVEAVEARDADRAAAACAEHVRAAARTALLHLQSEQRG